MSANERLYDREVSHQIGLQRYSTATVRKIVALLNRVDADIKGQIEKLSWEDVTRAAARAQRLDKLLEAIRLVNKDAYDTVTKALRNDLVDLAAYESEFQAKNVAAASDGSIPISKLALPKPEELKAAVDSRPFQGRVLREWGRDLDEASFKRVRDAIRIGYAEGESVADIVKRIRGTKAGQYKDGILEIGRRDAEGLVRTAVTHTANAAKETFFRANEGFIRHLRWSSVLDSRTSATCRGRDGQVFPVGKGPRPPAHWNCRSVMIPELTGGPAYEGQNYAEWLRKQPAEEQDEILGKTKGRLFRQGNLRLDRFIDRSGREYTLEQLRRREADAFARAGL